MSGLTMPRLPSKALFWKKRSANISDYDPTFRVIYLGNVLTGWAKGDGCVDKPLATLWKNHTSTEKPNIVMKVTVCASGLRAVTKEHGLTEYWAHRITFCDAEPSYPKVFCWIYRHEGRKMKQELRCHAVLCPSENKARMMAKRLKERLHQALVDFKKEKVCKQNARLSLANAADEQKTMPFRKIMLQAGSSNYRPPLEKGKSAPKLKVIEEVILEEDEEDLEDQVVPLDTNHITRLRVEGMMMPTSDSMPLLGAASSITSRCSSSLSMDALSTMTAVTSFMDADSDDEEDNEDNNKLNVQNLIVISSDPSPEVSRRGRPRPRARILPPVSARIGNDDAEAESSDDDDEVTDYLDNLSVEVTPTADSVADTTPTASTTTSASRSSSEVSPRQHLASDSDGPASPMITTRMASKASISEQDTISDESGYSEESNPSAKVHEDEEEECDLTVKGVLISEFSPTERLKYLQRSQSTQRSRPPLATQPLQQQQQHPSDFFQNKVPEFCINI